MARPRVADGGDGLQIWRVAANVLHTLSRTANEGRSSSLGVGRGLTCRKNPACYDVFVTLDLEARCFEDGEFLD